MDETLVMRIAGWLFVVFTVLCAVGLLLPAFDVQVGNTALGRRASMSLSQIATSRAKVNRILLAYEKSSGRDAAIVFVDNVGGRVGGKLGGLLSDVRSAIGDLDSIDRKEVSRYGTLLLVALLIFAGLHVLILGLVVPDLVSGQQRTGRVVVAAVISLLVLVAAIGIRVALGMVVDEIYGELGVPLVRLGAGAYVIPAAAIAALLSSVGYVILLRRVKNAAPPLQV